MSLYVRSEGTGPDLALIHGWGFPGAVWDPVVAPLARRFRVHCVDLPGYGGSHGVPAGSVQTIADQVMAALPGNVALCGWSLGAHVALAALARHSHQVRELVLVGATPCFVKRADWPHAIDKSMLQLFAGALRQNPAALLARFSALVNQGDSAALGITRSLTALAANPPSADVLAHGLDLLRDLDLRPLLAKIPNRTLLVHGGLDPLMPPAAARWAAAALPHGQLEIFEQAAHAPFLSQPERFAGAIAGFALTTARTADSLC